MQINSSPRILCEKGLATVADKYILLLIIDEFDRLTDPADSRLFADTIKVLSDYAVKVTVVLVGVADAVDDLIAGHESVQRNLVQIPMPRMSQTELKQIITDRLPKVNMTIDDEALGKICSLSRGLPHYAHLVGQHSAWAAIDADQTNITTFHVGQAMNNAIKNSQQTIQSAYHKATMSPRKDSLFAQVLLACALRKPMNSVTLLRLTCALHVQNHEGGVRHPAICETPGVIWGRVQR